MSDTRTGLRPGQSPRTVRDANGALQDVPVGWELLPPGDAGLTRAVKAMGPTWAVEEKRGRKSFSRGIWAPAEHIRRAHAAVDSQRADPSYQRKLEAGRQRRADEQAAYVEEFEAEVLAFLRFHGRYAELAADLAHRVTVLATPVGSGTVARTERIPVERRAEAAVIAWMRHQTTRYDDMQIVRIKGARREVRRELAERSRAVLQRYRRGEDVVAGCPLAAALQEADTVADVAEPVPVRAPVVPVRPTFRGFGGRGAEPGANAAATPASAGRPPAPAGRAPAPAGRPPAPPAPAGRAPAPPAPARAPAPAPAARAPAPPASAARAPVDPARAPAPAGRAAPPAPAGRAPVDPARASAPPAPAARAPVAPARAPAPAGRAPPVDPARDTTTATFLTPRTPEEEARHAAYLAVRARLTRGR
jgi:hypothetical protein